MGRRPASAGGGDRGPVPSGLARIVENLARYHREHEKFYAQARPQEAIRLQTLSRGHLLARGGELSDALDGVEVAASRRRRPVAPLPPRRDHPNGLSRWSRRQPLNGARHAVLRRRGTTRGEISPAF
jgi:hypothetical protein